MSSSVFSSRESPLGSSSSFSHISTCSEESPDNPPYAIGEYTGYNSTQFPMLASERIENSWTPILNGDFGERMSTPSWDLMKSDEGVDEGYLDEDAASLPSGCSLNTSPSLRSVHLQDQQRVSSIYYGMQLSQHLSRPLKKRILSVAYSERAHSFIFLDQAGIMCWSTDNNKIERVYTFPPYKHNMFLEIVYSSKFNVYFVLTKTRAIITFNSLFELLHTSRCFENSLLNITFLETRNLLIGAGVNGVSFWSYNKIDFKKSQGSRIRSQRPMENYILSSSGLTKIPDNKLIRRISISYERKWIFALSFYDVFVLSYDGKLLTNFLNLHKQTINDCIFNIHHSLLLTVSNDSTLALWSETGFLIHTFYSAAKSNTALLQHPLSPHLALVATEKGLIKCYNLYTLEEEFTQYIIDYSIAAVGNIYLIKQQMLFTVSARSISVFDFNYFCEFWGPLGNKLLSLGFDKSERKSDRFHALCIDGTIRIYATSGGRPLSVVLPPPDITFPSSSGSVAYDRDSNLLYVLLGPQEIWVYTTKTNPACRLEVYSEDVMRGILNPVDPDSGNFVPTGIAPHSHIQFCTCLASLPSAVDLTSYGASQSSRDTNILMLGLKDGRIVFVTTKEEFCKLFEIQVSVGEVSSARVSENYSQLLSQSASANGFVLKLWSLPGLELLHSVELHGTLTNYWRVQDILMAGFSDGSLSILSLKGMGSSLGRGSIETSGSEGEDKTDEILNIHGIERLNLFCTAHKSGLVKIWDHHRNLIKVIALNSSLNGVYFIGNKGDLLVAFNRHLYTIGQEHILSSISIIQGADHKRNAEMAIGESAIFEDPNSQNGELVSTKYGFHYVDTMNSYLKPYDIDLHGPNGQNLLDEIFAKELHTSVSSENNSSAHSSPIQSQLFLSPLQSSPTISNDSFPLPIFSTPTASPRATPPPSESEVREAVRREIENLEGSHSTKLLTHIGDPTPEQEIKLALSESEQVKESSVKASEKEQSEILVKAGRSIFNPRIDIKSSSFKQPKTEQVTFGIDAVRASTKTKEQQQSELDSYNKQTPAAAPHTRVLKKRRKERQETAGISLPTGDVENISETVVSAAIVSLPAHSTSGAPSSIRNGSLAEIKEVIASVRRERRPKLEATNVEEIIEGDVTKAKGEQIEKSFQEEEVMKRDELKNVSLRGNKSPKRSVLESQLNPRGIYTLSTNTDVSAGWQEREYLRRLAYRMKGNERKLKVRNHQYKLERERYILRAKFCSEAGKHSRLCEKPNVSNLLESMSCKEESQPGHLQTRNSSPIPANNFPSSTTLAHTFSTSSFYSHKSKLESQCNFRVGKSSQEDLSMKDIFARVPPNSRCVSAPFFRSPLS